MLDQVVTLARQGNLAEVAAIFEGEQYPIEALKLCLAAMRQLYWQEKYLHAVVGLAGVGIAFGESAAESDPERSAEILQSVKPLCYDLASFTWPGWDEPGIFPTQEEVAAGLEAAHKNLRYAIDLQRGDVPTARAYWMLGAHQLSASRYDEALSSFEKSQEMWEGTDHGGELMLSEGFILLSQVLSGRKEAEPLLTEHLAKMDSTPAAEQFTGQIRSAMKVLIP